MTTPQLLCLLAAWLILVPAAAAQIANAIANERIFARPRAYVEARWPGGLLAYLVRCPVCLAQQVCFLESALFLPAWWKLTSSWLYTAILGVVSGLAAARIAIKIWL